MTPPAIFPTPSPSTTASLLGARLSTTSRSMPTLPAYVGVRIVEHNSVHFVDDAPSITREHAQQLDRIVGLMGQFPAVEVHVVGNTDQRGGGDPKLCGLPTASRRRCQLISWHRASIRYG